MLDKGFRWPDVGQFSDDVHEQAALIKDEAEQLLEFGGSSSGRQCPYKTLAAFCNSVKAHMERKSRSYKRELQLNSEIQKHRANGPDSIRKTSQQHVMPNCSIKLPLTHFDT